MASFAQQPPPPPPLPGADAASRVSTPATLMMVVAALGILWGLLSIVLNLLGGLGSFAGGMGDQFTSLFSGVVGILSAIISIAIYGFVVFGSMKMKNLESHGMALGAAIGSMLPCSCCCLIGLPIGIWALVVLLDANVKAAFRS